MFRQANKVLNSHIHHIVTIRNADPAPRTSFEKAKAVLAKPVLCVGEAIEVVYALTYGRLSYRASRDLCRMLSAC